MIEIIFHAQSQFWGYRRRDALKALSKSWRYNFKYGPHIQFRRWQHFEKNMCLDNRLVRYFFEILSPSSTNMAHIWNFDLTRSCSLLNNFLGQNWGVPLPLIPEKIRQAVFAPFPKTLFLTASLHIVKRKPPILFLSLVTKFGLRLTFQLLVLGEKCQKNFCVVPVPGVEHGHRVGDLHPLHLVQHHWDLLASLAASGEKWTTCAVGRQGRRALWLAARCSWEGGEVQWDGGRGTGEAGGRETNQCKGRKKELSGRGGTLLPLFHSIDTLTTSTWAVASLPLHPGLLATINIVWNCVKKNKQGFEHLQRDPIAGL